MNGEMLHIPPSETTNEDGLELPSVTPAIGVGSETISIKVLRDKIVNNKLPLDTIVKVNGADIREVVLHSRNNTLLAVLAFNDSGHQGVMAEVISRQEEEGEHLLAAD